MESKIYFDFLEFYRLTKINYLWFSQPGRFQSLLKAVNGEAAPWTDEARAAFYSAYSRFRRVFKAMGGDKLPGTTGDAFLAYIRLHDISNLKLEAEPQLKAGLAQSWSELAAYSIPQPVNLELDPVETEPSKSILTKLLPAKQETLKALFLYERSPETSAWAHAHEEGRRHMESVLKGRVESRTLANVAPAQALDVLRQEAGKGTDVVFTTSPQLLPACLKAAAEYPEIKFLNCSVYSPHPSIRTYYGRMYEVKLLVGLIAGAMTQTHKIGYVADFPIYGTTAAINAFALGARMTDPHAQVLVEWRAQGEKGLWERLVERGVDMIAGLDLRSPVDLWRAHGLYQVADGVGKQIATWSWSWGPFYERILSNILDGQWKEPSEKGSPRAVNYWWGLSAGVVDFHHTDDVPKDVLRLVEALRDSMVSGQFRPFEGALTAQGGRPIGDGGPLSPEEIIKMDWLAENVVGTIPSLDTLTEDTRDLVRLQGVRAEDREEKV